MGIQCIRCDREIKPIRHDESPEVAFPHTDMWDGGAVSTIRPNYGSIHDCSVLVIGICDNCIDEGEENEQIFYAGDYMAAVDAEEEPIGNNEKKTYAVDLHDGLKIYDKT